MKKESVEAVQRLEAAPKFALQPPIRWLDLLMAVHQDRALMARFGLPLDVHRLAAFEAGFHAALTLNHLADPDAVRFRQWLLSEHLEHGDGDWATSLLQAYGGDHGAAFDRYLTLAAAFVKEARIRQARVDRRPERVEPGWAKPPVPPYFVKTRNGWVAAPSLTALRDAVRDEASKQTPHEAFDLNGRIIRLLARPNLKVRRELSRIVAPQIEAKLTPRRATRTQLHSALSAYLSTMSAESHPRSPGAATQELEVLQKMVLERMESTSHHSR